MFVCSLRPDFGRNADWLLEQCHKDLIGCQKRRRLNARISRVVVFVNDPPSAEGKADFAVFFIVLWSYGGRKICLNMYHGNSENSYGCSYLLCICFIYGTNVNVSPS